MAVILSRHFFLVVLQLAQNHQRRRDDLISEDLEDTGPKLMEKKAKCL